MIIFQFDVLPFFLIFICLFQLDLTNFFHGHICVNRHKFSFKFNWHVKRSISRHKFRHSCCPVWDLILLNFRTTLLDLTLELLFFFYQKEMNVLFEQSKADKEESISYKLFQLNWILTIKFCFLPKDFNVVVITEEKLKKC